MLLKTSQQLLNQIEYINQITSVERKHRCGEVFLIMSIHVQRL